MPSHGALSKAGKVRSITPRPERKESKPSLNPRVSDRKAYRRRVILGRNAGSFGTQGGQYDPFAHVDHLGDVDVKRDVAYILRRWNNLTDKKTRDGRYYVRLHKS